MPGRDEQLRQAQRFEAFLKQIHTPAQPYKEWVVIVWFHIALHYVDAFLAGKGHPQVAGHSDRWGKMARYDETRPLGTAFQRLYKDAKEARYEGGEYTPADLEVIERVYRRIRGAMRTALSLSAD